MIREPKANEVTHISCLTTGDRFYCKSDEKKEVWELRFHTQIRIRGQFKKLSQCRNDKGITWRFDSNRIVVFLRRTKRVMKRKREFSIDEYFA